MMTTEMASVLSNAAQRDQMQRNVADEARRNLEEKIRWASAGGATYREIGAVVGVSMQRIGQIMRVPS